MQTAVTAGDTLTIGRPAPIFRISSAGMMELQEFGASHYDIEPDGLHVITREIPGGSDEAPVAVIVSGSHAN